jgi:hypothetical protein
VSPALFAPALLSSLPAAPPLALVAPAPPLLEPAVVLAPLLPALLAPAAAAPPVPALPLLPPELVLSSPSLLQPHRVAIKPMEPTVLINLRMRCRSRTNERTIERLITLACPSLLK